MQAKGYMGHILRIDMTSGKISTQEISDEFAIKYIGGSGLGSKILFDETSEKTDPLGHENILIFMTGPVTGTGVPTSGRIQVLGKSPLTGIFGESDVGGTFGITLKRTGYDGVIFTGRAKKPKYIVIEEESIHIRDATKLWGKDTYVVSEILRNEINPRSVIASIGPAGEQLVKFASIMFNGKNARAAGRTGMGAVMGSKNLKAVVVNGSKAIEVAFNENLKKAIKNIAPQIVSGTKPFREYGTSAGLLNIERIGDLPIKNWTKGSWKDGAEKICGQEMAKKLVTGKYFCGDCIIGCGKEIKITKGPVVELQGAAPEYESLASLGALCLVDDIEVLAKANDLCNRYGIDTLSTGGVIAFAIEAFERGLITEKDTKGFILKWGDPQTVIEMVHRIGKRNDIGHLLGEGVKRASEKIGGLSPEFAVHVKGLELPMHDPRAYSTLALGYATSNRGACHLQAFCHPCETSITMPDIGYDHVIDRFEIVGKAELTAKMQNLMSMFDSLKVCKFLLFGGVQVHNLVEWLNLVTGWEMTLKEFMQSGERIFNIKRLYNVRCGISRKDDVLPPRLLSQKRGEGGAANNLPFLGEMLSQYYKYRGWTEEGIPLDEKIEELRIN